jgi:hypothetical protein
MEFSSWIIVSFYFVGFPTASRWRIAMFPSAGAVAWVRTVRQSTGSLPTFIRFLLLGKKKTQKCYEEEEATEEEANDEKDDATGRIRIISIECKCVH